MKTTVQVQFLDPHHGRLLPQQVFQHGLHLVQALHQLGGLAARDPQFMVYVLVLQRK